MKRTLYKRMGGVLAALALVFTGCPKDAGTQTTAAEPVEASTLEASGATSAITEENFPLVLQALSSIGGMASTGSSDASGSGESGESAETSAIQSELMAISAVFNDYIAKFIPNTEESPDSSIRAVSADDFIKDIQGIVSDFEGISEKAGKEFEEKGTSTIAYTLDKNWGEIQTGLNGFSANIPLLKGSLNAVGNLDETESKITATGNASLSAAAKAAVKVKDLLNGADATVTASELPVKDIALSFNATASAQNVAVTESVTASASEGDSLQNTSTVPDVKGEYNVSYDASVGTSLALPDPTNENNTIGGKIIASLTFAGNSKIEDVMKKISQMPQAAFENVATEEEFNSTIKEVADWAKSLPVTTLKLNVAAYDDSNKETYKIINVSSLSEFVDWVVDYATQMFNAMTSAAEDSEAEA